MNFKPILFSTPMVQAIMNGTKTQTRRLTGLKKINKDPKSHKFLFFEDDKAVFQHSNGEIILVKLPYGLIGDVLWVRETWQQDCQIRVNKDGVFYEANGGYKYRSDNSELPKKSKAFGKWKPSIYMPKGACRNFLLTKDIYIQKIQMINEYQSVQEGIENYCKDISTPAYRNYLVKPKDLKKDHWAHVADSAKHSFETLWASINGQESWDSNPFVFTYKFENIDQPEGFLS